MTSSRMSVQSPMEDLDGSQGVGSGSLAAVRLRQLQLVLRRLGHVSEPGLPISQEYLKVAYSAPSKSRAQNRTTFECCSLPPPGVPSPARRGSPPPPGPIPRRPRCRHATGAGSPEHFAGTGWAASTTLRREGLCIAELCLRRGRLGCAVTGARPSKALRPPSRAYRLLPVTSRVPLARLRVSKRGASNPSCFVCLQSVPTLETLVVAAWGPSLRPHLNSHVFRSAARRHANRDCARASHTPDRAQYSSSSPAAPLTSGILGRCGNLWCQCQ